MYVDKNRMAQAKKRGRPPKVADGTPSEGVPEELVPVPVAVLRCPHCGSAEIGQWERVGNAKDREYSRCRKCGTRVVRQRGSVRIMG